MGLEHLALGLGTGAVILAGFSVAYEYGPRALGTYLDNRRTESQRRKYHDKDIYESYYWRRKLLFP